MNNDSMIKKITTFFGTDHSQYFKSLPSKNDNLGYPLNF